MMRSKDIWLLVALFLGFFLGLRYLTCREPPTEDKTSSSYNADPLGVKAFYTLLGDRLGYKVGRLRRPYDKMPRSARVLIVVQPNWPPSDLPWDNGELFSEAEESALRQWVCKGGTIIFAMRRPFPLLVRDFKSGSDKGWKLGKGCIYAFDSPKTITNRGMRNYKNAVKMVSLVARHASRRDLVLFDEYHHGYRESESAWSLIGGSWKSAMVVLAAALAAALYSSARRFGAVREADFAPTRRPGSEFVRAMGRLYRRAGATDVAAQVVAESLMNRICPRLGVSSGCPPDVLAAKLEAAVGQDAAARIERAWSRVSAGQKPTEKELLDLTREVQQLEKELGLEHIQA